MGWIGGMGQGLQNFAGILGKQRERDAINRAQDVQWQRQQSLEALRVKSGRETDTINFEREQGVLGSGQYDPATGRELQKGELEVWEGGPTQTAAEVARAEEEASLRQKQGLKGEFEAEDIATNTANFRATEQYTKGSEKQQQFYDSLLAQGIKIKESDRLEEGMTSPKNDLLKTVMDTYSEDPRFLELDPDIQLTMAYGTALKMQNAQTITGQHVPKDSWAKEAKRLMGKKISAIEWASLDQESQEGIWSLAQKEQIKNIPKATGRTALKGTGRSSRPALQ